MENKRIFSSVNSFTYSGPEWVAWVDVMGVASYMERKPNFAAGDMFKFHEAVINRRVPEVKLYPLMDGVYLSTASTDALRNFLSGLMSDVIDHDCATQSPGYWVVIRGGIAHGEVIHCGDQPAKMENDGFDNDCLETQLSKSTIE